MKKSTKHLCGIAAGLMIASFSDAQIINTIAGGGSSMGDGGPATAAQLYSPYLMAVDASDNLYIADYSHYEIRKVDKNTGIISSVAGNGVGNYSGDGGQATAAELHAPNSVIFDAAGNFYISTGNRIRKVTASSGIITTFAGNDGAGYIGDGGQATAAEFNGPEGLAIDGSGNLLIADNGNYVVRKIDVGTGIISTIIGNGNPSFNGDGGQATAAEIGTPYDVAVDASGNIYFSDYSNMRIRKVTISTGVITTVVGNGGISYVGDGSQATATGMYNPEGVTIDKTSGDIIFAEEKDNSIRRVSASNGIINTITGLGFSNPGFSGDGGPATAAELTEPYGVTLSHSGNLYISDWYNNRIRMVSNVSGINEVSDTKNIEVYPVPTKGNLNIKLYGSGYNSLKICNVLGQEYYSQILDVQKQNPQITINALNIPPGIYILQVSSQQGVSSKRIVIQK